MLSCRLFACAAALAFCATAADAAVTYQFNIDTSSVAGQQGFIEFQFSASASPGGFNPTAMAAVSGFLNPGGAFTGPPGGRFGNVTGALPGVVQLDVLGDGQLNDYFQGIVFGTSLSFGLALSGQAVDAPICTGAPGTDCSLPGFALDFMNATMDQFLLTGDPLSATPMDWLVAMVQINEDGGTTLITPPGPGGGAPLVTAQLAPSQVPEPATWSLMLLSFGVAGVAARRRVSR